MAGAEVVVVEVVVVILIVVRCGVAVVVMGELLEMILLVIQVL